MVIVIQWLDSSVVVGAGGAAVKRDHPVVDREELGPSRGHRLFSPGFASVSGIFTSLIRADFGF